MIYRTLLAGAALALQASVAHAHISFETRDVQPGATVKLVLRVPHGCEGSPTTRIRVELPEVLHHAKPQPKAGWELTIVRPEAEVSTASTGHAHGAVADVREVSWSGGRLEDAYYDEFVIRVTVDAQAPAGDLYVPVVQECETGVERWIEIPAAGKSGENLDSPAPSLRITPGA